MTGRSKADSLRSVVYLLAIEDIVQSPLLHSQVFDLLKVMAAQTEEYSFHVVALYPVYNAWRLRARVVALRNELRSAGIALHVLPLIFATRYFYIPRALLPLFFVQGWLVAQWIAARLRPDVIHCRSYPASWVGMYVKKRCGARLIFDTRALYPEEGKSREMIGKPVMFDDASYKRWKQLESDLGAMSDVVVVVSQPTCEILSSQYLDWRIKIAVIPTLTHTIPFEALCDWYAQTRLRFHIDEEIVVAYAGSWVDITALFGLSQSIAQALPDAQLHFLFLIAGQAEIPSDLLTDSQMRFTILSLPYDEVLQVLAGADLAIQPVYAPDAKQTDLAYIKLANTILSVKFTEYLAAGLPVLISRWHGAAADLVQKNDLGLVYDTVTPGEFTLWLRRWQAAKESFRYRAWNYARTNFAIESIARRYLSLYRGDP